MKITFHSFLKQELEKVQILEDNKNFFKLTPKSKEEYQKRNWIFMPYGYSYLGEDNPFANNEDHTANKIFLGLIEVGHYALIIGGPFLAKSNKDKVMIPIIGLTGLAAWKFLIPWQQGNRQIESFNGIAKSGYYIPESVR